MYVCVPDGNCDDDCSMLVNPLSLAISTSVVKVFRSVPSVHVNVGVAVVDALSAGVPNVGAVGAVVSCIVTVLD